MILVLNLLSKIDIRLLSSLLLLYSLCIHHCNTSCALILLLISIIYMGFNTFSYILLTNKCGRSTYQFVISLLPFWHQLIVSHNPFNNFSILLLLMLFLTWSNILCNVVIFITSHFNNLCTSFISLITRSHSLRSCVSLYHCHNTKILWFQVVLSLSHVDKVIS